jgi:hypothetical protein
MLPSLSEHAAFVAFSRESSHRGVDPTSRFGVDFRGDSEARQPPQSAPRTDEQALRKEEQQVRDWKFEALIDAARHPDINDAHGEIFSDYFRLHIIHRIEN